MAEKQPLKCLIAAGGTAGHVLPSLAVAEALAARGRHVTFAGSPDRVEARLVPEAGFELDTFRVSGLPRRPGPALARALARAMRAPRACRRILRERQPDVVLGGGGYVAGPMVYAASRMGIPTALMEADAHLGLANRLAAPFARRVFLSFPIEGRDGPKYRVTGRPIPARNRADLAGRGPAGLRAASAGPCAARLRREPGSGKPQRARGRDLRRRRAPPSFICAASATTSGCAPRITRDDYQLLPFTDDFGAALAAADLVVARAGGSVWEIAAAGKPAILVPYPFATGGSPGEERRLLRTDRRRDHGPGDGARPRPRSRALAARRP